MKVTIYELMGLIKEDKAPEYIKMGYIKYKKGVGEIEYFDKYGNRLSDMIDFSVLEHEVEILEEEKKIPEKIIKLYAPYPECEDTRFEEVQDKINEIIDYLKSKGE